MKTNVVVAEQGKRPTNPSDVRAMAIWHLQNTPTPLANLRGGYIQYAVWEMRLLGISKIMIKQSLIGLRSIADVSFKAMLEQPPEEIKVCRNTFVRQLADKLTALGILELEIVPDEKEMKELQEFWKRLQEPPRAPDRKEIKLNTETDPTGDKVTDGHATDTADSNTHAHAPAHTDTDTGARVTVDVPAAAPVG